MRLSIIFIALLGLTLISCSNEDENSSTVSVNLNFNHLVDSAPVQLDQLIYKNALQQDFSIKTVKYFISDIQFHKSNGTTISFNDIHYIDIREIETLAYTLSQKIPAGDYNGISFIHGLAKDNNITGQFSEAPESLMEWPIMMGGGYHYMKLEGEYEVAGVKYFFNFHSGALDGVNYEVGIDLFNQSFKAEGNEINLALNMELQNWFTNPVDWDFTYFGSGIMGNPEAQETVQKNGTNVYSFTIIEDL